MKKAPAKTVKREARPTRRALEYKVVELSVVDEGSLEAALNDWVRRGWTFDGVQFAMRESSKRPAMGFVFFTREGAAVEPHEHEHEHQAAQARAAPSRHSAHESAWDRLKRLAGDDQP